MSTFLLILAASGLSADTVLEERIDLYDPTTSAFLGSELTWYATDGRRLRRRVTDADGARTLLFILLHDDQGRETSAVYFEGDADEAWRETFTYSDDRRLRTTTYYPEPGGPGERMESDLDLEGREVRKRYFRTDGSQYGEEDVLWGNDGTQLGWDFRYLLREGGASFRYTYQAFDAAGEWVRRLRSRDGTPERIEVRSRVRATSANDLANPTPFAPGLVSTDRSETSPSFSADGRTMVFARYGQDWNSKEPFIAQLGDDGWRVSALAGLGPVYNLSISPDGKTIIYAGVEASQGALFRVSRTSDGWSSPENLTATYGLVGTYPALTESGDLYYFDADGEAGGGIYLAPRSGDGFDRSRPVFTPQDAPFDAFPIGTGTLFVTRCFDEQCASGAKNGIWEVSLDDAAIPRERKLPGLPYGWGAQPVPALGLFVFTDGEEVWALPLSETADDRPSGGGA